MSLFEVFYHLASVYLLLSAVLLEWRPTVRHMLSYVALALHTPLCPRGADCHLSI